MLATARARGRLFRTLCSARIHGGYLPGARVHHDASGSFIFGKFSVQGCSDFFAMLFRHSASLAVDLACGTNRKLKSDSILNIVSDEHLGVDFLECNVCIASNLDLLG